jgi:hypothetical protein
VGWVVREQIRVIAQLDGDPASSTRISSRWVDGQPAVLVGLGVLTYALAAATT